MLAEQPDEPGTHLGIERLDQVAEIGFMQRSGEVADALVVADGDGALDERHELRVDAAALVAHRNPRGGFARGGFFGHRFSGDAGQPEH